jgi:hypothetical protein
MFLMVVIGVLTIIFLSTLGKPVIINPDNRANDSVLSVPMPPVVKEPEPNQALQQISAVIQPEPEITERPVSTFFIKGKRPILEV